MCFLKPFISHLLRYQRKVAEIKNKQETGLLRITQSILAKSGTYITIGPRNLYVSILQTVKKILMVVENKNKKYAYAYVL